MGSKKSLQAAEKWGRSHTVLIPYCTIQSFICITGSCKKNIYMQMKIPVFIKFFGLHSVIVHNALAQ